MCFIVDAFNRRIVGRPVAANIKTEVLLDALEMARASRGGRRLLGLVAHSDAGSHFASDRLTERLTVRRSLMVYCCGHSPRRPEMQPGSLR